MLESIIKKYKKLYKKDPRYFAILGFCYFKLSRYNKALKLFRKNIHNYSDYLPGQISYIEILLHLNKKKEILNILNEIRKDYPNSTKIAYYTYILTEDQDLKQKSMKTLRKYAPFSKIVKSNTENVTQNDYTPELEKFDSNIVVINTNFAKKKNILNSDSLLLDNSQQDINFNNDSKPIENKFSNQDDSCRDKKSAPENRIKLTDENLKPSEDVSFFSKDNLSSNANKKNDDYEKQAETCSSTVKESLKIVNNNNQVSDLEDSKIEKDSQNNFLKNKTSSHEAKENPETSHISEIDKQQLKKELNQSSFKQEIFDQVVNIEEAKPRKICKIATSTLGNIYSQQNEFYKSRDIFYELLQKDPKNINIQLQYLKSNYNISKMKIDEELEYYKNLAIEHPENKKYKIRYDTYSEDLKKLQEKYNEKKQELIQKHKSER